MKEKVRERERESIPNDLSLRERERERDIHMFKPQINTWTKMSHISLF